MGGARFARGLVAAAGGRNVTVVGNVGDDLEVLGMSVSPDLDSILYALAGLHDEERGWGRAGETWEALATVSALGGEDWFRLGDRDLGLHLVRTQALRDGEPLSAVTARLARALGIEAAILPATDDRLRTWIDTPAGSFQFQEWFVARGHRDDVDGVRFEGDARAGAGRARGDRASGRDPDRALEPLRQHLADPGRAGDPGGARGAAVPSVAVSPLVGGRAVKGPADRMLARMAGGTTPEHVAGCYAGLIDALVVDESDPTGPLAVRRVVTRTLMTDLSRRLAEPRRGGGRRDRASEGGGVKVAVVGGTGSFGQAVAKRLVDAGVEVVIGSRDAERAREAAAAVGATGANNDDAVRGVDLVVFAVKADAAVETARDLRQSIGSTPVLSVCAELGFGPGGVKPTMGATSIAKRIEDELDAPVVAGLHSLAAANLAEAPPDEDALVCGDDAAAKALALELAARLVSGSAIDCGPLASARALEGMTAVIVNVNKRYKAHAGIRLTGVS